jgi:hypothetical protein
MTIDNGVRVVAGTFVLLSLALGIWVNPWWFAFTAFVGVNLIQSAFTGFCPAAMILGKLGCTPTAPVQKPAPKPPVKM